LGNERYRVDLLPRTALPGETVEVDRHDLARVGYFAVPFEAEVTRWYEELEGGEHTELRSTPEVAHINRLFAQMAGNLWYDPFGPEVGEIDQIVAYRRLPGWIPVRDSDYASRYGPSFRRLKGER